MLVYHFIDSHYGLENICNRRLKISRLIELNDPFEFLGFDLSDRVFRAALKETKEELSQSNGLLCFSNTWQNPVLWSHYADRHRGICLGFEVTDAMFSKVEYIDIRPTRPETLDKYFMKKLLFTKFSHWKYEQEYRVFVQLEEEINGLYFSEFSEQLKLKSVIIGDQSSVTRLQLSDALGDLSHGVKSFKARAGFKKFEVVRNMNDAMWA